MISDIKEVPTEQDTDLAKLIQDTRGQLEKLIFGLKVDVDALKGEIAALKKAVE
jgi:hypothetical protein